MRNFVNRIIEALVLVVGFVAFCLFIGVCVELVIGALAIATGTP